MYIYIYIHTYIHTCIFIYSRETIHHDDLLSGATPLTTTRCRAVRNTPSP